MSVKVVAESFQGEAKRSIPMAKLDVMARPRPMNLRRKVVSNANALLHAAVVA